MPKDGGTKRARRMQLRPPGSDDSFRVVTLPLALAYIQGVK